MPTGQPAVRLHGRAAARAEQLEMGRIAVSITHESDYAVAIAFGVRTAGGRYVFPLDIEARLDDRERRILAGWNGCVRPPTTPRIRRRTTRPAPRSRPVPERRPVGFGRRDEVATTTADDGGPFPAGATKLDDDIVAALLPERPKRGHKGTFGKLLVIAGSLDYAGAALLVCRAAGRAGAGLVTLAVPESLQPLFAAKVVEATTMGLPEDDVEEIDPEPALARILDHEHDAHGGRPGPAARSRDRGARPVAADRRPGRATRRRSCSMRRRSARWRRWTAGGRATTGRPS